MIIFKPENVEGKEFEREGDVKGIGCSRQDDKHE